MLLWYSEQFRPFEVERFSLNLGIGTVLRGGPIEQHMTDMIELYYNVEKGCLTQDQNYQKVFETDTPPEFIDLMDVDELSWNLDNDQLNSFIPNNTIAEHDYIPIQYDYMDLNNNCISVDGNFDLNYSANIFIHDLSTNNLPKDNSNQHLENDVTAHHNSNSIIFGSYGILDNNCDRFHVQNDFNGSAESHAVQVRPYSHSENYLPALNIPKKRGRKPLKQTEQEREMKRKSSNRLSQKKARDRKEREKDDLRIENDKLRLELDIAKRQIEELQSRLQRDKLHVINRN